MLFLSHGSENALIVSGAFLVLLFLSLLACASLSLCAVKTRDAETLLVDNIAGTWEVHRQGDILVNFSSLKYLHTSHNHLRRSTAGTRIRVAFFNTISAKGANSPTHELRRR
ncbi:hypothetical protein F5Y16DRAFT_372432 [Xylariaceae sp. FL0255]|nr:hypothetical protein F5Y16DRAFT_372432 [Xylariaceae sp. FL0255]